MYVGSTLDLYGRLKEHARGHQSNKSLWHVIVKYGLGDFPAPPTHCVGGPCPTPQGLGHVLIIHDLGRHDSIYEGGARAIDSQAGRDLQNRVMDLETKELLKVPAILLYDDIKLSKGGILTMSEKSL